jgi:peptide/nickel transport system ATP-binding protein
MQLNENVLLRATDLRTNFYTFEGTVHALNGIEVEVLKGETFGLVGESGCGKSVTVRSIAQVVQSPGRIESGSVLFAGRDGTVDLLAQSERYMTTIRGNDISMIFQEAGTSLNPVLTIGDQVGESLAFHRLPEMLEKTITRLHREMGEGPSFRKARRALTCRLLETDLQHLERVSLARSRPRSRFRRSARGASAYRLYRRRLVARLPLIRRYRRWVDQTIEQEVVTLLGELGVPNPEAVVRRYPHELSGGMQQRIVIAIALACHPVLLIADEPTSNLDVTIQAQILELIKQLKQTRISSVLFITHDLGVVAEVCDRVGVMYAGDVCEVAPVRALFRNPLHPYTVGLLNSVPREEQTEALATIPGVVPNLIHPPTGCRFHPRCPRAMEICSTERPDRVEIEPGHTVACHLYTGVDADQPGTKVAAEEFIND